MRFTVGEINIICTNLERSLRFYRDVLGFESLEAEPPGHHLRCGNADFLLLAVARKAHEIDPYCSRPAISIDLMVDNLEEAYQHLKSNGAEFVAEFERDSRRFFVRDPDGLVLEVIARQL